MPLHGQIIKRMVSRLHPTQIKSISFSCVAEEVPVLEEVAGASWFGVCVLEREWAGQGSGVGFS